MKTVLITGCSSGYGLETARHFHAEGSKVIATMRTPRAAILPTSERMRLLPLDVTKPASIAAALDAAGPIDVLVNNAGIGVVGVFEVTPMSTVRDVFETNTFGVIAMTQAVLPQFRARGEGVVVNVTSSVTLGPMPQQPRSPQARWRSKDSLDRSHTSSRPSTSRSNSSNRATPRPHGLRRTEVRVWRGCFQRRTRRSRIPFLLHLRRSQR